MGKTMSEAFSCDLAENEYVITIKLNNLAVCTGQNARVHMHGALERCLYTVKDRWAVDPENKKQSQRIFGRNIK